MSTSAELIQTCNDATGRDYSLFRFQDWIKDFSRDAAPKDDAMIRFRGWLDDLSDQDIAKSYRNYYNPIYLNLLTVFGSRSSAQEIHRLAVKCMKSKVWSELEYYRFLSKLPDANSACNSSIKDELVRLDGWKPDLLRSLLERGRGLILCTYRIGLVRFIATEMALMGFKSWVVTNEVTTEAMQSALDSVCAKIGDVENDDNAEMTTAAKNIRLLQTINAEKETSSVHIVDALKRGEIVGFCIEGNTGTDGPWGDTSKTTVEFFDHRIKVKNGVARLAAALGTPLLPVVALEDATTDFGRLIFGEPIITARNLKRSQTQEFVQSTMQSLYTLLEHYARRHPEQWEGWSAMHRWRVREHEELSPNCPSLEAEAAQVSDRLSEGKLFKVNTLRIAKFSSKTGMTWVDLKTLKGYQNPTWCKDFLQVLSGQDGLGLHWIGEQHLDYANKAKVLRLLAYLKKMELVITV